MSQSSAEMQARIEQWLRHYAFGPGFNAVAPKIRGCERLLRSKGINAIPLFVGPGIVGDAVIDGLLIAWFNEHRTPELRHADAEQEHDHRDLMARLGAPLRPYKGPKPRRPNTPR
jgi:hypothetical protein